MFALQLVAAFYLLFGYSAAQFYYSQPFIPFYSFSNGFSASAFGYGPQPIQLASNENHLRLPQKQALSQHDQRQVWQNQIEKVKMYEERLRLKSGNNDEEEINHIKQETVELKEEDETTDHINLYSNDDDGLSEPQTSNNTKAAVLITEKQMKSDSKAEEQTILEQEDIKKILIESIQTKDGLKTILKQLLQNNLNANSDRN